MSSNPDRLALVSHRQARSLTRDVLVGVLYLTGALGGLFGFVIL